jgi:L-alanine-DL-glutamate epimerase-like enolase superfamily enzyme
MTTASSIERDLGTRIADLRAATVRLELEAPMRFGEYVVSHREYAIVAARSSDGTEGIAFGLTRDAPVAAIVDRLLAPLYGGAPAKDPATLFAVAQRRHPAVLVSGVGLRALSLADLATWDLAARLSGRPLQSLLGGGGARQPAVALAGFPPTASADEVALEAGELVAAGFRRLKLPVAAAPELTRARLEAVRAAAPGAELMLDIAWSWSSLEQATDEARGLRDLDLTWIEDPFLPGDAKLLTALRRAVPTPLAVGDEQGGGYFPHALLDSGALDVLRVDATCMGGATGLRLLVQAARSAGVGVSAHIYPALHGPLLGGLGAHEATLEWGRPGAGLDPLGESVWSGQLADGQVELTASEPGFGFTLDRDLLLAHDLLDPNGIFGRGRGG